MPMERRQRANSCVKSFHMCPSCRSDPQVLQYLLRRSYALIYRLISSSEPISEELMPIANKLATVKRCVATAALACHRVHSWSYRCLNEVYKQGGPFTPRDLYPYQLALFQVENQRKDGKFLGANGNIPGACLVGP